MATSIIKPCSCIKLFLGHTCNQHVCAGWKNRECDLLYDPSPPPSKTIEMSRAGQKRRRVQEVNDSDDQPDEPQQLHWFSTPAPTAPFVPPPTTSNVHQIHPGIYGVQAFVEAQQYEGDASEEQVLEHLQNQPPPRYGKVNLVVNNAS